MSLDDTAKWSMEERLKLADMLARIEERLVNQDRMLEDLLDHAESAERQILATSTQAALNSQRIRSHEKIAAVVCTLVGSAIAAVKAFL